MQEADHNSATVLLGLGADYAAVNRSEYTRILFLLSKAMVNMNSYSQTIVSMSVKCLQTKIISVTSC
jgi:hypothetical protein